MGKVTDFLNDEPNFLEWGKNTAKEFTRTDLPQDQVLPEFHRDMYQEWYYYYTRLIPHLRNNLNGDPRRYKIALEGEPDQTKGQNHVLIELQDELKKLEAKASPLLVAHLASLRELLNIEETTNTDLIDEPNNNW